MNRRAALILSLMILAGCASPVKTRYYSLSDGSPPPATAHDTSEYRVAIGPVTMPETLDRPQIMLRTAPNRYTISDTDNWSEPLKREIPRVLAENIGHRLPSARVAGYQQHAGQNADYRVLIDVLRFESVPGVSVTLEANWIVQNRRREHLREARSVIVGPVNAPGIAPLVAEHRAALGTLGREIAAAVDALTRTKR